MFNEHAGWCFGCDEQKTAPKAVKDAIDEHEAVAFRPRTEGRSRHEFPAMMAQLLAQLTKGALPTATSKPGRGPAGLKNHLHRHHPPEPEHAREHEHEHEHAEITRLRTEVVRLKKRLEAFEQNQNRTA